MDCFIVIYNYFGKQKSFVIVEEPEAHLYPAAQRHMMELLALAMNSSQSHLFITTHSPYIMTSSNLLIHSGKVEQRIKPSIEQSVVKKQYRIMPSQVAAYKFGEPQEEVFYSIMDEETGMINASEIDTISDVISEDTDRLLDLEIKYDL